MQRADLCQVCNECVSHAVGEVFLCRIASDVLAGIEGPTVSVAFRRVCRRLGVTDFRFHDLRHCTGSWLTMNNVPDRIVGEVLGHRDSRMTRRYQQLADEFVDQAVAQLDKTFGNFEEILGIKNHQEATTLTLPA